MIKKSYCWFTEEKSPKSKALKLKVHESKGVNVKLYEGEGLKMSDVPDLFAKLQLEEHGKFLISQRKPVKENIGFC